MPEEIPVVKKNTPVVSPYGVVSYMKEDMPLDEFEDLYYGYLIPETKPPSMETLKRWVTVGVADATDGCKVALDGVCKHGCVSWPAALHLMDF